MTDNRIISPYRQNVPEVVAKVAEPRDHNIRFACPRHRADRMDILRDAWFCSTCGQATQTAEQAEDLG